MGGHGILIDQLRAEVERLRDDRADLQERCNRLTGERNTALLMMKDEEARAENAERFIATADSEWKARAEKAERERDAAVAAIAASERRAAEADVHLSDAESRRRTAGSNAIEWESRAKNAERALAAAGESADAIRAMLGGADDLVIAVRCLADRAEKAERERDALRHHYDKAGPEHNLLALLDMYDERRAAAESERDEARAERDARPDIATLPTEYVCGEWIMSGQAEPDAVVTYTREPGPETGHVGWCWWARGKMGESRDYMAARDAAEHSLIAHAAKVKP